ncbi:MAG TPA: TIGR04255 family protein [Tepidisphaeraceae bacterium]|nr:TIGR04255 family protein [Tepidisphaeraceae bacterium]
MISSVHSLSPVNIIPPAFGRPPVIETVMGVQFEPIAGFANAHLGLFWARLGGRASWPFAADQPPLDQDFERFGDALEWMPMNSLRFGVSQTPISRMQLSNAAKDRMVQLQNGRLIYNWLGADGRDYVRYEKIRPDFDSLQREFQEFLADQQLPALIPNQWEITYLNHLPKGTVWHDPADWRHVFSFHAVPQPEVNQSRLESFNGSWAYEIEPHRGRLRMQIQHGRSDKGTELLVFKLTARGPIREGDGAVDTLGDGISLGHDIIVKAFGELTSSGSQAYWEKELPK